MKKTFINNERLDQKEDPRGSKYYYAHDLLEKLSNLISAGANCVKIVGTNITGYRLEEEEKPQENENQEKTHKDLVLGWKQQFKDADEYGWDKECYQVEAIRKGLMTEAHKKLLFDNDLSVEDILNGRVCCDNSEEIYELLFNDWNKSLTEAGIKEKFGF